MTHTYTVNGMHCDACIGKVRSALANVEDIESVRVSLEPPKALVTMKSHVPLEKLNSGLSKIGVYSLSEESYAHSMAQTQIPLADNNQTTLQSYYPLLLVFIFLIGIATILTFQFPAPGITSWMTKFMAGFFLVFSF